MITNGINIINNKKINPSLFDLQQSINNIEYIKPIYTSLLQVAHTILFAARSTNGSVISSIKAIA